MQVLGLLPRSYGHHLTCVEPVVGTVGQKKPVGEGEEHGVEECMVNEGPTTGSQATESLCRGSVEPLPQLHSALGAWARPIQRCRQFVDDGLPGRRGEEVADDHPAVGIEDSKHLVDCRRAVDGS